MREYQIGFLLSRASWAMASYTNKQLRQRDLGEVSMGFLCVLMALWSADGVSISELGEIVKLEKSTMTGLIDRMEKAGLIERRSHPSDRRAILIYLTDKGNRIKPVVEDIVVNTYRELTRGIKRNEIESTEAILGRIIDNVDAADKRFE